MEKLQGVSVNSGLSGRGRGSVTNCFRPNERDVSFTEQPLGSNEREVVIRKGGRERKGREGKRGTV